MSRLPAYTPRSWGPTTVQWSLFSTKADMRLATLPLAICALVLTCCTTKATLSEQAALTAVRVGEVLDRRHYAIDIQTMYPRRGGGRTVSYGFSLTVKGDTLESYLPFFGRAYSLPYGGGKGLNFTERIASYHEQLTAKGVRHIELQARNEEDNYLFTLDIQPNGHAYIHLQPHQRESISYDGEVSLDHDKQP